MFLLSVLMPLFPPGASSSTSALQACRGLGLTSPVAGSRARTGTNPAAGLGSSTGSALPQCQGQLPPGVGGHGGGQTRGTPHAKRDSSSGCAGYTGEDSIVSQRRKENSECQLCYCLVIPALLILQHSQNAFCWLWEDGWYTLSCVSKSLG